MMLSIDPQPRRRPIFWIFPNATAPESVTHLRAIDAYAKAYDEESGDTVAEYVETLGVSRNDQRLIKSAIRRRKI